MERFSAPVQNRARITKGGHRNRFHELDRRIQKLTDQRLPVSAGAGDEPAKKARKKPRQIRPKENPRAAQKSGRKSCTENDRRVSRGPTKRIWLLTAMEQICQIRIQNRISRSFFGHP